MSLTHRKSGIGGISLASAPALAGTIAALLTLGGCGVRPSFHFDDDPRLPWDLARQSTYGSERGFSYWNDQPGKGPLRVTIDLSDQAAYFYRGGEQVGRSRVATGLPGHTTPIGSYSIIEKTVDKRSNLYGQIYASDGSLLVPDADSRKHDVPEGGDYLGASMPYWMRLTSSGIGMHAGPIPRPGSPASHGCIRMPADMAQKLFTNASIGTPVNIVR